ncbi:uncharacterized protein LOC110014877 [Oryzias latipes]|uniref:uncharacterized protein LOC110014877 n=1 Tax=Oryzias latipes TaxID=8090 RepID=UPI000CE17011|nr:uncharacterized protein LOC110014877 [Oryzias latipes]
MMEKSFSRGRQDVVVEAPIIPDFKARWPALLSVGQLNAEFQRITTVQMHSKFFMELDDLSPRLLKVYAKKGGLQGQKLVPMTQSDDTDVRPECILKRLCVDMNQDPERLVREHKSDENTEEALADTVLGIFAIRHTGADPSDDLENVGIILEGVKVINDLKYVSLAVLLLFFIVYALNLSYPSDLKYTFEVLQKIIMGLDGDKLSNKVQVLKPAPSC